MGKQVSGALGGCLGAERDLLRLSDGVLTAEVAVGLHRQCPAIFVVADSVEIPDEKTGTNMITATMKFFVSVVVEGQDAKGLTILTERYQSALFKLLHWQTLQDTNFNVKDFIRVVRFQFSPLYTKTRKGDNMGDFRKEVSLELEIKHYENPTT